MGKRKTRTSLLHCPVCGHKPHTETKEGGWYAHCDGYIRSESGIKIPTHNLSVGPHLTLEQAAKAWNHLIRSTAKRD
ncbi:MAG: hypothetical protein LBI05_00990 [Planctomycetaceae bacterium]|jgi:hypothetical protein|nr:hypothetical protein [Planctomycetaceae bacterium]